MYQYNIDNIDNTQYQQYLERCIQSRIMIQTKNNGTTTLVTFDLKSLYTSIPHDYGLEAIRFWVEKHPDSLHSRFSKGFVLEIIKIILEKVVI